MRNCYRSLTEFRALWNTFVLGLMICVAVTNILGLGKKQFYNLGVLSFDGLPNEVRVTWGTEVICLNVSGVLRGSRNGFPSVKGSGQIIDFRFRNVEKESCVWFALEMEDTAGEATLCV